MLASRSAITLRSRTPSLQNTLATDQLLPLHWWGCWGHGNHGGKWVWSAPPPPHHHHPPPPPPHPHHHHHHHHHHPTHPRLLLQCCCMKSDQASHAGRCAALDLRTQTVLLHWDVYWCRAAQTWFARSHFTDQPCSVYQPAAARVAAQQTL